MYPMLHSHTTNTEAAVKRRDARSQGGAGRWRSAVGSLVSALALAVLLVLMPAVVGRVGGPDSWWLVPFVMLALLSAGGLLVVLGGWHPSRSGRTAGETGTLTDPRLHTPRRRSDAENV